MADSLAVAVHAESASGAVRRPENTGVGRAKGRCRGYGSESILFVDAGRHRVGRCCQEIYDEICETTGDTCTSLPWDVTASAWTLPWKLWRSAIILLTRLPLCTTVGPVNDGFTIPVLYVGKVLVSYR
jgi:hypothetical protein